MLQNTKNRRLCHHDRNRDLPLFRYIDNPVQAVQIVHTALTDIWHGAAHSDCSDYICGQTACFVHRDTRGCYLHLDDTIFRRLVYLAILRGAGRVFQSIEVFDVFAANNLRRNLSSAEEHCAKTRNMNKLFFITRYMTMYCL